MDSQWLWAFVNVLIIGIVLSGDNAIIIAMACIRLPKHLRKKAVFWGTFGAVAIRIGLAFTAVKLLRIPLLHTLGAVLLISIASRLLLHKQQEVTVTPSRNLWSAIQSILVADTVMGVDNVVAVAGASQGYFGLVIVGILVGIPLMIWGSHFLIDTLDKHPVMMYLGGTFIAWTAGSMITQDTLLQKSLSLLPLPQLSIPLAVVSLLLLWALFRNHRVIR